VQTVESVSRRLSGGRRRTLHKQGAAPGKPGRPKGRANEYTPQLLADLYRDLAWLGEPQLSHSRLSRELANPKKAGLDLVQVLVKHDRKYLHLYRCDERALRRHIAAIQKKIWRRCHEVEASRKAPIQRIGNHVAEAEHLKVKAWKARLRRAAGDFDWEMGRQRMRALIAKNEEEIARIRCREANLLANTHGAFCESLGPLGNEWDRDDSPPDL
jgi:hypothetical protein